MERYTVKQAAEILGVSRITVFRYIKDGKIKANMEKKGEKDVWIIGEIPTELIKEKESETLHDESLTLPETLSSNNETLPETFHRKVTPSTIEVFQSGVLERLESQNSESIKVLQEIVQNQRRTIDMQQAAMQELIGLQKQQERHLNFVSRKLIEIERNQKKQQQGNGNSSDDDGESGVVRSRKQPQRHIKKSTPKNKSSGQKTSTDEVKKIRKRIEKLKKQGYSQRAISRASGISEATARDFLKPDNMPKQQTVDKFNSFFYNFDSGAISL